LARHFLPSVRALHVIPFDDHLAEVSEVDLDRLSRQTRQALSSWRAASPMALQPSTLAAARLTGGTRRSFERFVCVLSH
jgi:hypothetical protein